MAYEQWAFRIVQAVVLGRATVVLVGVAVAAAVGAGVVGTATVTGAVVRRAQTAARGRTTVCGDGGGRPRNTKMYINPLTWK